MLPAEQGGESRLVQRRRLDHGDMMPPRSGNCPLPQGNVASTRFPAPGAGGSWLKA